MLAPIPSEMIVEVPAFILRLSALIFNTEAPDPVNVIVELLSVKFLEIGLSDTI